MCIYVCNPLYDWIRRNDAALKGDTTMVENEKKIVLTRDGYEKLEKELEYYTSVRRNEIAEQIAVARGFGDLSENAEYDEAKNEQSRIEAKIIEMENALRNAEVVDDKDVSTEVVGVGNKVTVKNLSTKAEQVYTIVGANETDPRALKISNDSPIGNALLGKKVGQTVTIAIPAGSLKLKIQKIDR